MKLAEAVKIISKKNPLAVIRSCLEYDTFYLFALAPIYISNNEDYVTGTIFPAVNKKTGEIFQYDITSDLDAYEAAVPVIQTTDI